ncbi:hypothetical protein TNCV_5117681 [Trichonephila clavipes]|nr:hypothetical protein TNCV_5117681 [Trichonephila clavipes]
MSSKIGRPDWTTSEPAVAVLCQKSYLKFQKVKEDMQKTERKPKAKRDQSPNSGALELRFPSFILKNPLPKDMPEEALDRTGRKDSVFG